MDIDIDFPNRSIALGHFEHVLASTADNKKHNSGIYVQNIPYNPLTNQSTIDFKTAQNRGYFKIDFLNVSAYEGVQDEEHLIRLLSAEPDWQLLEISEISDTLFHLNGHSHVLQTLKPNSLEKLAAVLAIIRPAKRHLINCSWEEILKQVWIKPENNTEYFFKKSHSFAYASVIVVQLNLLSELS